MCGRESDRQQDDPRLVGPLRDEPGVQQHDLAADARKHVIDIEIIELRLERELVAQHLAERRNVPLAVAEIEELKATCQALRYELERARGNAQ